MKKLLIAFICLILGNICSAQTPGRHYYLNSLSIKDGLSQNTVNDILQDKSGFMWFGTKDGLNRYDASSFRIFKYDANDKHSIGNNYIIALYEDKEGNIWVGTDMGLYIYYPEKDIFEPFKKLSNENTTIDYAAAMITGDKDGNIWITAERQGLFYYNLQTRELINYTLKEFPFLTSNVHCVVFDNSGTTWVYGNGLFYSKDGLETLHPFVSSEGIRAFDGNPIMRVLRGAYNCLYVASVGGGVQEVNLSSGKVRDLLLIDETGERIWCRELMFFSDDELWIGCESGVYIYNLRTNKYIHLSESSYDPYSLSDNAIYSMCKDREGGVWIGSYFGGINYYPHTYTYFDKYYPKSSADGLHGKRVREFCKDNNGKLWIGTEDGGLNRFDPETKEFRFFTPSLDFTNVHGLCSVGDELWVGTFSKGLKVFHSRTGNLLRAYGYDGGPHSINDNNVFAICKTAAGEVYVGTGCGLMRYDRQHDAFINIPEISGIFVYDIKEDTGGNLWLATYVNGVFRYDVNKKKWTNYVYDEKDRKSIPNNKVLSVFEDARRNVWLTTQGGGLCLFHPETENFTRYDMHNGLPNDVIYQVIEDDDGIFWLTTNSGLVAFNHTSGEIKVYTTANGLPSDQFNYRSGFKDKDGTIYLGSIEGFIAFNPKTFSENKFVPPAVITDFLVFNKEMRAGAVNSPLKENITYSDSIWLRADQNSFSFRLAALGYQAPKMNRLMYKLDGFDDEWLTVGESPLVTYSNLHYGNYVFRVKAANSDGIWNKEETTLHVRILPPFYLSSWAYCIYTLLFLGCIVYLYLYIKNKSNRKQLKQMEKFEQEKEREIYHAKIDFFTNVAHEIRTPLTLIKGPLENIILKKNVDVETREDLNIMKQNTERLLNLANQLLDFRKTERQGFSLNFTRCNITEVVKETYLRFTPLAKQKELAFTLDMPETQLYAHINKEAFIKILSNLLSNAMKYAESYVQISLETNPVAENGEFHIRTINDGLIVPDAMKEEIFKPFVRFSGEDNGKIVTGTGIGLALSRSLAELHQGTLKMVEKETANVFCLTLPTTQDNAIVIDTDVADNTELFTEPRIKWEEHKENDEHRYTVLIVEDNPDMLSFVTRQLSHEYTVLTATNGEEALHVLDENFVNLIVSDVVMPLMDGFELCRTVKSKLDYSHIPVVLLTAKTNVQSKVEGLELGADAYIEKPFSPEYLHATISNLIKSRENLRQTFARSPFVAANTMALTKADEEFIRKLNEIILSNLHNSEFSMEDMAGILNMSRSNFYRKIKGVLDLNPNEYLRLERLKRAAQLLQDGESRVNEICYLVGFNSPSYFSKCFLKQFGVLPKDFVG